MLSGFGSNSSERTCRQIILPQTGWTRGAIRHHVVRATSAAGIALCRYVTEAAVRMAAEKRLRH